MSVFVLDRHKKPLMPCSEKRARLARWPFVYELWVSNQTKPFYVGKATYETRPYAHTMQARHGDKSLKASIIRKARASGLTIIVKKVFLSEFEDDVFAEECRLIALYGRRGIDAGGILANMTLGGEGRCGHSPSIAQRQKMSATMRGRERSLEHRQALSAALAGRIHSLNTRSKIAATLVGRILSPAHRRAVSFGLMGHGCSDEGRKNMSAAQKGRTVSQDHRDNLSRSLAGRPRPESAVDLGSKTVRIIAASHVETQIKGGTTQAEYCLANGIAPQTFCGWKRSKYVVDHLKARGICVSWQEHKRAA